MKKYDGIVIASDWDGTLSYQNKISDKNKKAILQFMENGGKFSIVSGRYYPYLKSLIGDFSFNAPYITLNGAYIKDEDADTIVHEAFIDAEAFKLLDKILRFHLFEKIMFCGENMQTYSFTVKEYKAKKAELLSTPFYKIALVSKKVYQAKLSSLFVKFIPSKHYDMVRSWNRCLEIIKTENDKGVAVLTLKKYLQAKTLITVGDYENDIAMLKSADIGIAVGDALPNVKHAADLCVSDCKDDAIAYVIDHLDNILL